MNEVFSLSDGAIENMLRELAVKDTHIKTAIDRVGIPASRQRPHGFATVLNTIVSQQLSVKAAAKIYDRVKSLLDGDITAQKLDSISDDALRAAGLSRQKVTYTRSLSHAVTTGGLDFDQLPDMDDDSTIAAITTVKGLGVWSAQMYLMFALGRRDIWPVLDLAVQKGAAQILNLDSRPKPKELEKLGEVWRPYRSAVALLSWHYYANPPL